HVPEYRRGDRARSMSDHGIVAVNKWMLDDVRERYRSANANPRLAVTDNLIQLRHAHHGNHRTRRLLTTLHVWIEIGATGDKLPFRPRAGNDLHRLRDC